MIMTCLTFHEASVELPQVFIIQPFAQPFEPLAAARLYQRKDQQPVQQPLFFIPPFC